MKYHHLKIMSLSGVVLAALLMLHIPPVQAGRHVQQPTVAIPTVTSSPVGVMVVVKQSNTETQIKVRSGPETDYTWVGILVIGQEVPGLGRTAGGNWVMIAYPGAPGGVGWVYSPYVDIIGGELPIVEPPPTPTPRTTPTIDPTLAAQFIVEIPPTRLPTFTPPPPLNIPTFPADLPSQGGGGLPMGLIITALGVIGVFGLMLSFLRGR